MKQITLSVDNYLYSGYLISFIVLVKAVHVLYLLNMPMHLNDTVLNNSHTKTSCPLSIDCFHVCICPCFLQHYLLVWHTPTSSPVHPTEVPEEDVFVCECRYNEVDKDVRRLKGLQVRPCVCAPTPLVSCHFHHQMTHLHFTIPIVSW